MPSSRVSEGYEISNTTLFDPANRPVKVIGIGAGVSGLMMAYKIQTECENVELKIYEKNPNVGGTWFENRYPGCDVPAHAYVFPWAPNPEWTSMLAGASEISNYLNKVADCFDLRQYIHLNHQVAGCFWDEERGKWKVKVQIVEPKADWSSREPLRVTQEFWDEGDIVLHATGILNRWSFPNIPGLESFKGRVIHTAGWPDDYREEHWKGQNVAVIGSGASSIQVVPTMQKHVKHMDVFARTPNWFVEIAGHHGNNRRYDPSERERFRKNPEELLRHIKETELMYNAHWDNAIMGTELQKEVIEKTAKRMKDIVKDDTLLKGITPSFPVSCRRITPGDPYLHAIQEPNVNMHFTGAARIEKDGVVGEDGTVVTCDTIVCATGFDTTWKPRFPVVGRNGVDLREKWRDSPAAYFGVACPDMPNWITFLGPNWPVAQGSIIGAVDANGSYAVMCIKKLQSDWLHSFCPRQDVTNEYNEHTQIWAKKTVWSQDCRSWYKDLDTGRVTAVYCGHSLHYRDMLSSVRWEDMDIRYTNKCNRFAFMGIGRPLSQVREGSDISPYFGLQRIDKRWRFAKE
ncbi:hypothetical protein GTA08_BOTSDO02290 [Neofusicoccum parvum]|nr:hypothetical protein GTA08_BOTSDO02290 [Neofusicoccum parvum]